MRGHGDSGDMEGMRGTHWGPGAVTAGLGTTVGLQRDSGDTWGQEGPPQRDTVVVVPSPNMGCPQKVSPNATGVPRECLQPPQRPTECPQMSQGSPKIVPKCHRGPQDPKECPQLPEGGPQGLYPDVTGSPGPSPNATGIPPSPIERPQMPQRSPCDTQRPQLPTVFPKQ